MDTDSLSIEQHRDLDCHLFEERLSWLENLAQNYTSICKLDKNLQVLNLMEDSINSISEALSRNCYEHEPYFNGEE